MAENAARSALTNGLPEVLLEVHLQKYLQQYCQGTLGQIVRTRRNPASQTIIPRLSQCSSRAQRHASPAIRRMSDFRDKSAKTDRSASLRRLTARLPDVGTVTALPSGLIRLWPGAASMAGSASDCLQGAVIAYQSGKLSHNVVSAWRVTSPALPEKVRGSTRMGRSMQQTGMRTTGFGVETARWARAPLPVA